MGILQAGSLQEAVTALFGENLRIVGRRPVYGGDINQSYRLSFSDGTSVFMKCNGMNNLSFFEAEAEGLAALGGTGAIGVPRALALGTDRDGRMSFLLMEYLEAAPKIDGYWEVFGRLPQLCPGR